MKTFVLTALSLLLSFTASAQFWGPHSRVLTDSIHSDVLDANRAYTVYLPKSFDANPDKTYPVLYIFHGIGGTNLGWFNDQRVNEVADRLIASGEAKEMVIVSPNAGGNMFDPNVWSGYFNMPGWNYEDFFFTEFLPYIEKTYRCGGSKGQRALAGLSMGGGGATSYGQRHPDMFGSVYAMSALMNIPEMGAVADNNPGSKLSLLNESVNKLNTIDYVKNADDATKEQLRTLEWFVDCGDDDFLLDRNLEFMHAMRAAGIPMQLRVRDGGHDNEYWHSGLFGCLPFVSRNFK